jgi:hypothetical protein
MLVPCPWIVGRVAQLAPRVAQLVDGQSQASAFANRTYAERTRAKEMASLDNKKPDLTSGEAASAPGFSGHGPDVMLGVWSSWLNAASSSAREWSNNWDNFSKRWWQITPDAAADQLLASGGSSSTTFWRKIRFYVRLTNYGMPIPCAISCRWTGGNR